MRKQKKFKDFHVIDPHTEIDFGQATVSFFKTTHIPDSIGVSIKTKRRQHCFILVILEFDQSAIEMYQTDYGRLAEIGKKASWRYLVIHQMLKTQPSCIGSPNR